MNLGIFFFFVALGAGYVGLVVLFEQQFGNSAKYTLLRDLFETLGHARSAVLWFASVISRVLERVWIATVREGQRTEGNRATIL